MRKGWAVALAATAHPSSLKPATGVTPDSLPWDSGRLAGTCPISS